MHKIYRIQLHKAFLLFVLMGLITLSLFGAGGLPNAQAQGVETPVPALSNLNSDYFTSKTVVVAGGTSLDEYIINGPPTPPKGTELERKVATLPEPNREMGIDSLTVPAFNWFFGCSATSGSMIAAYYDRNGFAAMYTGPKNGGVMPLDNSLWPTWFDGSNTYGQCPLTASHNGLDDRSIRGSIDDYWVSYGSSVSDPYITNGWTQHAWGDAIGDYMKTSQSAYGNTDGSTTFYNYSSSATQLTCSDMEAFGISGVDGTYGRKLFYQAKGYTVTTCYSQRTDNIIAGGFSFAQFKAEIDAGRPVMLNLAGHTIVGVGYDAATNTVYLHDTWDYATHSMIWGGSYSGMQLLSVSIVNLAANSNNPVPTLASLSPTSATAGGTAFTLTVNGSNFISSSVVMWNGATRTTNFVSATQLTAAITAADIAAAGTYPVTVFNPTPGGGTSNAVNFPVNNPDNPVPTLTSLSPVSGTAGTAFSLTVTGTNFISSSVVMWNGIAKTTTYMSATKLTAAIPAADIPTAGTYPVTVFNPTPGGGTSNAVSFSVKNPVPTLTSLSPATAIVGGAGFTLTITGAKFINSSVVRWNGSDRVTTYVSVTRLTAAITAADIATLGTYPVTVFNPTPGGGTSTAKNFTVAPNPVPTITTLSPTSAIVGGVGFTLTVTGTKFISSSIVMWNGAAKTTTYVSATKLTAAITAADIATLGTYPVTVFNPAPGGGTSNAVNFSVKNPVPTLTSLSPATATVGGAGFTLTIIGTKFISSSVVRWNGTDRITTYVSATRLTIAVTAADIATTGIYPVTVVNPTPGGGTSAVKTFTVKNPVPTLTSLSPTTTTAGGTDFTLTVTGTKFISGSVVRWNGSARTTTYVSPTQLTVTITAADIATAGTYPVTVFNPTPGGGTSTAKNFKVNSPVLASAGLWPPMEVK